MEETKKIQGMDSGVDWSQLSKDLLGQIAIRLPMIEDLMAFRGVCTGWRYAAPRDKFLSVSKVPLLMLPGKSGSHEREFYSLSKRKICTRKLLPEAKGKRCTDVGFGWVLALATKGTAFLFKPLSSAPRIELPSYKRFPEYSEHSVRARPKFYFITRGVLTANPSETSNFMLIVNTMAGSGGWKNGDENWMEIPAQVQRMVVLRDGKMYALVCKETPVIEIRDPLATDLSKPQAMVPVYNAPQFLCSLFYLFLVESTVGEILLIIRYSTDAIAAGANRFGVLRVDLVKGECKEMHDLGKDALFLGDNAAVSVDATEFPGVLKPSCIYFTDDHGSRYHDSWLYNDEECPDGAGKDMGIYNVQDGSLERFGVESFSRVCPPLWVFPSF